MLTSAKRRPSDVYAAALAELQDSENISSMKVVWMKVVS
jgi:hypothetical protein